MITDNFTKNTKLFRYNEYKDLIINLAENGDTTGEKTISRIEATKINAQRFSRIDKYCELSLELIEEINKFKLNCLWILITESWCGDGAQCIPVIAKIAGQAANIELILILRDENPQIMDRYLTNGSRSIPKLICIDKNTNKEIGIWGPRPYKIQKMAMDFKTNNPCATHEAFVANLHLCYARDKTNAIQDEFVKMFNDWDTILYQNGYDSNHKAASITPLNLHPNKVVKPDFKHN